MSNRMNLLGIFAVCFVVILAGCSSSDPPDYIPTQAEWEYAKEAICERALGGCHHYIDPEGARCSVDFFINRGKWYAIVISLRNDHEGIVKSYVGFLEEGNTRYARIDTTRILAGDFASRYADLVSSDSCWTLINSSQDWTEKSLEELWGEAIKSKTFGVPGISHMGIDLDLKRQLEERDSILE